MIGPRRFIRRLFYRRKKKKRRSAQSDSCSPSSRPTDRNAVRADEYDAGTIAFLAYGAVHITDSIWKGQAWGTTIKHIFDGLIYGLLTAGFFGWLWP